MRRPKALVIKALRLASGALQTLRVGMTPGSREARTELESVRRRLELLLTAMYGRKIRIERTEPVASTGAMRRLVTSAIRERRAANLAESDAVTIRLPHTLTDSVALGPAAAQYRLLAIEHAERIARGTAESVPARSDPLERDLYLLAESVAVDEAISRSMKGMPELIRNARAAALAARPALSSVGVMEREVEDLTRSVLSGDPESVPESILSASSPSDSLAWARETASRIRTAAGARSRVYRGVAPVALWGTISGNATFGVARTEEERMRDLLNSASMLNTHLHQEDGASGPSGANPAPGAAEAADRQPGENGAEVETDPTDENGSSKELPGDESGVAKSLEQAAGARDDSGELLSDMDILRNAAQRSSEPEPDSAVAAYPEWDCNAQVYRQHGAIVRSAFPPESVIGAADAILAEYGPMIRALRKRFERMRARRVQLPRQRDGDELDLAACVRSLIDFRTGHSADDRLYVDVRPARKPLAITLLVDVSGSTADQVSDHERIIDVERVALLLASEALDALGDRYSILAFSSHGAADVRVVPLKTFAERNNESVRGRITAIEPHGKTRLGAAVRHASAQLIRQSVSHRILLILSDGKPNDTDRYFEHYAAEDTRQAILEARAAGVYPFCLTVDRDEGSEYLAHIFGSAGHTILRQPEQLPFALLKGMQHLLAS